MFNYMFQSEKKQGFHQSVVFAESLETFDYKVIIRHSYTIYFTLLMKNTCLAKFKVI